MKLYRLLYGAMALSVLGACSDRDFIPAEEPGTDNTGTTHAKTDGYIAIEIKLPQEVPTRAEDNGAMNDRYGDGTAEEYKVDNALIAIFKGDSENNAVFQRAQKLYKPFFSNLPADDGIAASYIAAIEARRVSGDTDTYWALVVLNTNEETSGITTDDDGNETLLLGGKEIIAEKTKFSEIKGIKTANSFISKGDDGKDRFFMINAPMSKKKAGEAVTEGDICYLTNLGSTIYATPEEAKTNVAGCVYVERAMSKVTCQNFNNNAIRFTIIDENGNEADLTKDGWEVTANVKYALSNTSKESFLIRNIDFSSDLHFDWSFLNNSRYRMLGTTPIPTLSDPFHQDSQNLYRTYWCRDPHYDNAMRPTDKDVVKGTGDFKALSAVSYCKENTFQVKNMNYNSTTLAIFQVDFNIRNSSKTFTNLYVRDGNNEKVYLSRESAYYDGIERIVKDVNIGKAIKAAVVTGKSLPENFSVRDHLTITIEAVSDGEGNPKYLEIKDIELNPGAGEDFFDASSKQKFNTAIAPTKETLLNGVNAMTDVTVYEGGIAYYTVPIKHFGDYYTPWKKEDIKGTTTDEVYNDDRGSWENTDHAQKYLGRYGMVRNNWYDLNISKISALGSSVIPDSNLSLSDDNNEDKKYFSVEIHILSWAKRLQNIEL